MNNGRSKTPYVFLQILPQKGILNQYVEKLMYSGHFPLGALGCMQSLKSRYSFYLKLFLNATAQNLWHHAVGALTLLRALVYS